MKSSMLKYKWMCVAVFCCAMFAACEPTEVASDQNPISFNNGPARAQQVPDSNANARIWAYYTTSTPNETTKWVWNGEKAKLDIDSTANTDGNFNDTFTVNGNTKYWDNGTYNFYSIYSEDFKGNGNIATYERDTLTFTYSIANQKELRLATATDLKATNTRDTAVPFQFNHILSRIKFRGSSSVDGMSIQMTKFIVTATKTAEYAIADTVICTLATDTIQLPYADGVDTVIKAGGFKYKDATDVLRDSESDTIITLLKYTELPYAAALANGKVLKKIENGEETDEDYGWLVFPTNANEISIRVEYVDNQGIITKKTATLPSTTTLEMGKSYIFQFSIQPAGPIVFDDEVTINDWGTETDAGNVEFK